MEFVYVVTRVNSYFYYWLVFHWMNAFIYYVLFNLLFMDIYFTFISWLLWIRLYTDIKIYSEKKYIPGMYFHFPWIINSPVFFSIFKKKVPVIQGLPSCMARPSYSTTLCPTCLPPLKLGYQQALLCKVILGFLWSSIYKGSISSSNWPCFPSLTLASEKYYI